MQQNVATTTEIMDDWFIINLLVEKVDVFAANLQLTPLQNDSDDKRGYRLTMIPKGTGRPVGLVVASRIESVRSLQGATPLD